MPDALGRWVQQHPRNRVVIAMTLEEAVAIVKPLNDRIAKGPTPGAIEAAHQIGDAIVSTTCASRPEFWTTDTIRELAILIDRETSAVDMLAALQRIAKPHDCGCRPCTGQCLSQEALQIYIDEFRDIARATVAKATGAA